MRGTIIPTIVNNVQYARIQIVGKFQSCMDSKLQYNSWLAADRPIRDVDDIGNRGLHLQPRGDVFQRGELTRCLRRGLDPQVYRAFSVGKTKKRREPDA